MITAAELRTDILPGMWARFCADHAIVTVAGTTQAYSAADPDVRLIRSGDGLQIITDLTIPEAVTAAARLALAAWARFGGPLTAAAEVRQAVIFAAATGAS